VFTSSITGNLVAACAVSSTGIFCRVCVTVSFTGSALIITMLALKLKLAHVMSLPYLALLLFALEFSMLITIWAVGFYYLDDKISASKNINDWYVILVGCLMGTAMGFHNVAAKESITGCPSTTVMTSTLVNFSSSLAKILGLLTAYFNIVKLTPPNGPSGTYLPFTKEEKDHIGMQIYDEFLNSLPFIGPLFFFFIGAVIGGGTMKSISFNCFMVPSFLIIIICGSILLKIYNDQDITETDGIIQSNGILQNKELVYKEINNKSPKYEMSLSNLSSFDEKKTEKCYLLQHENATYL
jgi:chromate transport protein ChrA